MLQRYTTYNEWLEGRAQRRALSKQIAPEIIQREASSSDRRLRKLYDGARGKPFSPQKIKNNESS